MAIKRQKNRLATKVKADIEATKKIVREDVYDVLKQSFDEGKTRDQAIEDLSNFVKSLSSAGIKPYLDQHGSVDKIIDRIISDINSYGIDWGVNEG